MLSHLPVEILLAFGELLSQQDVKNLCEVSKHLYRIFTPILYERLTIWAKRECRLEDIDLEPLLRIRDRANNLLRYTKHMHIRSTFHTNLSSRCEIKEHYYQRIGDDEPAESLTNLLLLLDGCRDNSLRSFVWTMGTCIPVQLLDHLSRKQKNIESLIFITDGGCMDNEEGQSPVDLSAFQRLRELSWSGLRSESDMKALNVALKQVSHQLENLELDFIRMGRVRRMLSLDADGIDRFFAHGILGLPPASTIRVFPTVQVLSLSNIPFQSVAETTAHMFDWGLLRSLTLRFCNGWEDFLSYGSSLCCPTRLKFLEIQSTSSQEIDTGGSISRFLGTFRGLEQLLISNSSPSSTLIIWDALDHHKTTLKTFVYHQKDQEDVTNESHWDVHSDSSDLSLSKKQMMDWSNRKTRHPLNGLGLDFLGLCCCPELLLTLLSDPFIATRSLRILHVRQSGADLRRHHSWGISNIAYPILGGSVHLEDTGKGRVPNITQGLHDLAQWAFSPEGLLSLQVIAYGDFSYEGRYAKSQVLLVRNIGQRGADGGMNEPTFRHILPTDQLQKVLIDEYSDVLSACPSSPMVYL